VTERETDRQTDKITRASSRLRSTRCDSIESLVSNDVILVQLGEEIPLERGHQRGVPPPLEIVILPLLPYLA